MGGLDLWEGSIFHHYLGFCSIQRLVFYVHGRTGVFGIGDDGILGVSRLSSPLLEYIHRLEALGRKPLL